MQICYLAPSLFISVTNFGGTTCHILPNEMRKIVCGCGFAPNPSTGGGRWVTAFHTFPAVQPLTTNNTRSIDTAAGHYNQNAILQKTLSSFSYLEFPSRTSADISFNSQQFQELAKYSLVYVQMTH